MSHKCFCVGILCICFTFLVGWFGFGWFVDPIGICGAPVIRGFNHYKIKQGGFLDVYKPYEYIREKPDILYIGASQMYVGFEPICKDYPAKKVYSMGLSSLSLPDMREYLRFIYKVHKPEIIYMGIAPESFDRKNYDRKRSGYSKERLEALASPWLKGGQLLKDFLGIHDMYKLTVSASKAHKSDDVLFLYGWDTKRGRANAVHPKSYYAYLNQVVNRDCKDWDYVSEGMDCIKDILREAKAADVPMVVFFTPNSLDRYAMIQLMGYMSEHQRIKRMVAEVTPVYDFEVVSELTINRQEYFYDAWHFRASLGEKLKPIIEGREPPEPYGYLLTPETVDDAFAAEDSAWEKWKAENSEYVQALTECIGSGRKPEVGDFKKYMGF